MKAAMEDPRFMPVTHLEVNKIIIEISVLSPLSDLQDIEKIEIGKHGLVIDAGYRRGLLLPQVATEYNWNCKQFLQTNSIESRIAARCLETKRNKTFHIHSREI